MVDLTRKKRRRKSIKVSIFELEGPDKQNQELQQDMADELDFTVVWEDFLPPRSHYGIVVPSLQPFQYPSIPYTKVLTGVGVHFHLLSLATITILAVLYVFWPVAFIDYKWLNIPKGPRGLPIVGALP